MGFGYKVFFRMSKTRIDPNPNFYEPYKKHLLSLDLSTLFFNQLNVYNFDSAPKYVDTGNLVPHFMISFSDS